MVGPFFYRKTGLHLIAYDYTQMLLRAVASVYFSVINGHMAHGRRNGRDITFAFSNSFLL